MEKVSERTVSRPSTRSLSRAMQAISGSLVRTPTMRLELDDGRSVHAKLESAQPYSGSTKDRSAAAILQQALRSGSIGPGATVVESSSGNFAVACALMCRTLGLDFVPVLDDSVNVWNRKLLEGLCREVVMVPSGPAGQSRVDARRAAAKSLVEQLDNAWWPDQYSNGAPVRAHRETTVSELLADLSDVDEIYVAVGTGGTLSGVIEGVAAARSKARVIAVDAVGSLIFSDRTGPRHLPGMGSALRSELVRDCWDRIDDVVMVREIDAVRGCRELAARHGILAGGSTGAVFSAIKARQPPGRRPPRTAFLVADRGLPYLPTIYDDAWVERTYGEGA